VASITVHEIEAQLGGTPPSARNAFLRVLAAVLNYGVKREWLQSNPVQKNRQIRSGSRRHPNTTTPTTFKHYYSPCLELDLALLPYTALALLPTSDQGK